ncbi:MAG TPA: RNA polymerase sigma factor [Candidatus Acidoferrum sp.]|nr:RNA polymerase sigma factor [Candidatus Acidoferrum sp.]
MIGFAHELSAGLTASTPPAAPARLEDQGDASAGLSLTPDEELAEAAQRGEMEAFEELVARHRHRVYARAFSMLQHHEDALDLAQEAWGIIWQKLHQFQNKSSFVTWMTRIVINLCLDQLRSRRRRHIESLDQLKEHGGESRFRMPGRQVHPAERIEREEFWAAVGSALGRLSPEHRAVLVLHEFEEMPYKDIARTVGCSLGTVMSRLFYARRKMAALLSEPSGETPRDWRSQRKASLACLSLPALS